MRWFLTLPLIGSEGDPERNDVGGGLEESAGSILVLVNHGEPGIAGVPFHAI